MAICTVSNGPHALRIEADSLYRAILAYDCRIIGNFPEACGFSRPGPDDILEVTVEGRDEVYRATHRQAMNWANQKTERRGK